MPKHRSPEKDIIASLDRLPAREEIYEKLKKKFGTLATYYGFEEVFTPPIEYTRQFSQLIKSGMVDDRMPVQCKTKSGEDLILRSSGILSAVRSYASHKMADLPHPVKLAFEGEIFFGGTRRSSDIGGRFECGLLMVGDEGPVADAEVVQIIWKILEGVGVDIKEVELRINAIGCNDCFPSYRSALTSFFRSRVSRLCRSCRTSVKNHPVRTLTCADEKCHAVLRHAPQILDYLCDGCKKHLRGFLEFLDELKIPYYLDSKFFRDGLWFNTLIFEFAGKIKESAARVIPPEPVPAGENPIVAEEHKDTEHKDGGEDNGDRANHIVLGEGGICSKAFEMITGKKTGATGAELYVDRLIALISRRRLTDSRKAAVFLIHLGELAKRKGLSLMEVLRYGGIDVKESLGKDSIKSQLKVAEKIGAKFALIVGQKEALDDTVIVRELLSGIQETVPQEKLVDFLKVQLKK